MGTFLKPPATRPEPSIAPPSVEMPVVLHVGHAHGDIGAVRTWCRSHANVLSAHGIRTPAQGPVHPGSAGHGPGHPDLDAWLRDIAASTHGDRSRGAFYSGAGATGPVVDLAEAGLYPHLAQTLRRVAAVGKGLDLHVQFVVADHAAFLEATYVRQVADGLALTFEEFLDVTGRQPSWIPVVETLVDSFGRDRVIVYDGEAGRPVGDRVAADAMARLGVAHLATRTPRRRTAGRRSGRAADLRFSMRPHLRSEGERAAFGRFLRSDLFVADRPATFLAPEHAAALSARYTAELRQLREIVQVR